MAGDEFAEAMGAPPADMELVLKNLPHRIGVYVPVDLIEDWFGPSEGMSPPPLEALTVAANYGPRFDCAFKHDAARKEGGFWKWVPGI